MRGIAIALSVATVTLGLVAMAAGARHESRGRLGAARALGRRGGFAAAVGALALACAAPSIPAGAAAAVTGGIALLGGLSGKPRPSWWIAASALAVAALLACYTLGPP